jgi:hypothetical protein
MCCDCVHICPEKDTLAINKKGKKWLPAIILIILIAIGFIIGKSFEVPTIAEYWGDNATKKQMSIYEKSGLKNIKCYGSSISFANKMRHVKGIEGVTTFVGSHTVKIWFNPSILDTLTIQKSIFVPAKIPIDTTMHKTDSISVYNLKIDNFFDPYDTFYLTQLLKQNQFIYGFITEFGCPVSITIYTSIDKSINTELIKNIIEQNQLKETTSNNSTYIIDLNFRVTKIEKLDKAVLGSIFIERMK